MIRNKQFVFLLFALIIFLSACGSSGPDIRVESAWLRPDPLWENAAGYLVINNDGDENDVLIDIQVEIAASSTLHQTVFEGDIHKMEAVPRLEIPAGGQIILQPLSYHLMVMDLESGLEYGQTVTYTLEFEKSGVITVEAEIRPE